MKLSGREAFMILGLLFIVLFASYWFLLLSPAINDMNAKKSQLVNLQQAYSNNMAIVNANVSLDASANDLHKNIATAEVLLLPQLKPEVITANLTKIFEDAGFKCVTEIKCDPLSSITVMRPDGSTSDNTVSTVKVNLKVSGTDGSTPGGETKIGYTEFMNAVKAIEALNSNSIHISSISMEDTTQGFQYFLISVDVYAFNLPAPEVSLYPSLAYIKWERASIDVGGEFGIPLFPDIVGGTQVFASQLNASYFRPFATGPVMFQTGSQSIATPSITPAA